MQNISEMNSGNLVAQQNEVKLLRLTYKDGDEILEQYEGEFQHGQYHGQGKLVDKHGEELEGTFKENKFVKDK